VIDKPVVNVKVCYMYMLLNNITKDPFIFIIHLV